MWYRHPVPRFPSALSLGLALALCAQPKQAQPSDGGDLDVVFVLDNSGSMKTNDPNALMRSAVSRFASGLAPDSRLGIVVFDESVRVALPLTPAAESQFDAQVQDALKGIDYTGQWTDIPGGIERALYALREEGRPGVQRVVVFFTDGIVETGNADTDLERSRWLQESLSQEARKLEVRIFGIAFTERADFQLIQSVAQRTGGEHYRVLEAADIGAVFDRVNDRIHEVISVRPQPAQPSVTLVDPQWFLDRWQWVVGVTGSSMLVIAFGLVWLRKRRETPPITAHLRGIGDYGGEEAVPIRKRVFRVGRGRKINDLVIAQDSVSSQHAQIVFRDGSYHVRDLRSSNHSFLNGEKFSDRQSIREVPLKHGDHIRFDAYEFEFTLDDSEALDPTRLSPDAAAGPSRTRLRAEPPVGSLPPGQPPKPKAPDGHVEERGPAAQTKVRPDMCPNHPAWKASEMCPKCKEGRCKNCMTERDGQTVCTECAKKSMDA